MFEMRLIAVYSNSANRRRSEHDGQGNFGRANTHSDGIYGDAGDAVDARSSEVFVESAGRRL